LHKGGRGLRAWEGGCVFGVGSGETQVSEGGGVNKVIGVKGNTGNQRGMEWNLWGGVGFYSRQTEKGR